MTVKEAIVIFAKQFPDKAVVGYWDKPNTPPLRCRKS